MDYSKEDIRLPIYDITIADLNREHNYSHIVDGIEKYSQNWELVEEDKYNRGSTRVYRVQGKYDVKVSRNGLSMSGNNVVFSEECPEELINLVCFTLFEKIFEKKVGEIKENGQEVDLSLGEGSLKIITPKSFVLQEKCSEKELKEYYDEISKYLYDLVNKYHDSETVQELKEIVDWYKYNKKQTYRKYTDFQPTIVSQVVNNMDLEEWNITSDHSSPSDEVPNKIDGAEDSIGLQKNSHLIHVNEIEKNKIEVEKLLENNEFQNIETVYYDNKKDLQRKLENLIDKY